jgi:phosphatidylglycerophosphate synthase
MFLASFGMVLNWLGDSLDGSLARHRRIERPRYGYFFDHAIDSFNVLLFALGLGLSPYVAFWAALFLLCGFYLLSINIFLVAAVDRRFRLTFCHLGPTELRLLVVLFNVVAYALGPIEFTAAGTKTSAYTWVIAGAGAVFIALFLVDLFDTARKLARLDRLSREQISAVKK